MARRKPALDRSSLDVQQLRVFLSLVERGSVTSAAKTLGLAQSTVSESLAALERSLGARVILRGSGSRRMLLTAVGEALLPHARAIVAALDEAHSAVAAATNCARAAVDIVANESVGTYVLPAALAHVRLRWPNTRFSISVASCGRVRQGVEKGRFDLGVLLECTDGARRGRAASPLSRTDFTERVVLAARVPLVIFGSPAHPLAGRSRSADGSTLARYRLFLSDAAGDFHALVSRFFDERGLPGPRLESAGTVEGVKRAIVEDARALGILPAFALEDELRSGRFARINLAAPPPTMQLEAVLSLSRSRHPGTGELLDAIRDAFESRSRLRISPARRRHP